MNNELNTINNTEINIDKKKARNIKISRSQIKKKEPQLEYFF
jgi:hypothetical protein